MTAVARHRRGSAKRKATGIDEPAHRAGFFLPSRGDALFPPPSNFATRNGAVAACKGAASARSMYTVAYPA